MGKYYVYVLLSRKDHDFYVGFTNDLSARLRAHTKGEVSSTRTRAPLELVYWEGCLDQADSTQREKYLKSAPGQAIHQEQTAKLSHRVKDVSTTMIYTHVLNKPGLAIRSPLDEERPSRRNRPISQLDEKISYNSR